MYNGPPPSSSSKNHTYLLEDELLMNSFVCDTKPPLHIGALRIVISPSGAISGEFLIAISYREHLFIGIWAVGLDLEEERVLYADCRDDWSSR